MEPRQGTALHAGGIFSAFLNFGTARHGSGNIIAFWTVGTARHGTHGTWVAIFRILEFGHGTAWHAGGILSHSGTQARHGTARHAGGNFFAFESWGAARRAHTRGTARGRQLFRILAQRHGTARGRCATAR